MHAFTVHSEPATRSVVAAHYTRIQLKASIYSMSGFKAIQLGRNSLVFGTSSNTTQNNSLDAGDCHDLGLEARLFIITVSVIMLSLRVNRTKMRKNKPCM